MQSRNDRKNKSKQVGIDIAVGDKIAIEYRSLATLTKATRNPKLHDISTIKASIRRHGFITPLVEDARTKKLVAGHGRLEALSEMLRDSETPPARIQVGPDGTWSVPVVTGVAFKNTAEAEMFLLADNRLVELGGWDETALAPIFEDFGKRSADALAAIGWSTEEMAAVIASVAKQTQAPEAFPDINPGNVTIQYCCPKCAYKWSGSPDPAKKLEPAA